MQKLTKLDSIVTQLCEHIGNHKDRDPARPLPSVRSLATSLSTSTKTIVHALQLLVEKGSLCQDRVNGRYYLPNTNPRKSNNYENKNQDQWISQTLSNRIIDDLLTKSLIKKSTLPSMNELRMKFHCSHAKISAVLKEMVKQGILKPEGRQFRLNAPISHRMQHSKIFITGLPRFLYNFPYSSIFREIELAFEDHGWPEPGYLLRDRKSNPPFPPEHEIAGVIALHHDLCKKNDIAPYLTRQRFSQVLIDPTESIDVDHRTKDFTKIWPDNAYAGRIMAMHLLSEGHKRIAFLTHIPIGQTWLDRRIQGLQSIYPFEADQEKSMTIFEVSNKLVDTSSTRDSFRILMNKIFRTSKILANEKHFPSGDFIHANTVRPLSTIVMFAELAHMFEPIFEKALQNSDLSAWVCVNDDLAALAQEFLRRKSGAKARKITIVGFDNLPHARMMELTSFDFAFEKMGRVAANSFLFPSTFQSKKLVRIRGNLIIRNSSHPT